MSFARVAFVAALMTGAVAPAHAAATGTLTFLEPSGTVGPNDSIPVWMRLTIDPTSQPFVVDSLLPGFGVDPADVPPEWTSLDRAYINTYFTCNSTFAQNCTGGPPYNFDFNFMPGPTAINGRDPLVLQPGESHDYLFGTFVPSAGAVPAGTYLFYSTGVTLNLFGKKPLLDESGMPVFDEFEQPLMTDVDLSIDIARSCASFEASCAFSRTVVAVPEPETYAMMLAGLGLLGVAAARRRRMAVLPR